MSDISRAGYILVEVYNSDAVHIRSVFVGGSGSNEIIDTGEEHTCARALQQYSFLAMRTAQRQTHDFTFPSFFEPHLRSG